MTEETSTRLVPQMRFPEFRNEPGWTPGALGDIATFTSGGTPSKDVSEYWNGHIPWISASSMYDTNICDSERKVTALAIGNGTRIANAGSLLILTRGSMLYNRVPMGIASIDVAFNQDVRALTIDSTVDTSFLMRQLIAHESRIPINDTGIGAGKIDSDDLRRLPIAIPSLTEQQKIAACLDSLDDLITAERRKVEALKRHKQGLMQHLFPQPGEVEPQLRFPDFRNKENWEECKAGDLFVNRINKGEAGLPLYSVTMHDGMVRRDSFDRNYHDIEEATGNKKVCENDIAYNMMRMWQGALGVAPEDCLVSPAYIVLTPQKNVVSKFFDYLFKLPATLLQLTSYSRGLTKDRLRLYYDDFARIPLCIPSEPEQQRIADFLTAFDTCIDAHNRRLDALKQHKQGLMKQLFPSIESNEQ